MVGNGGGLGGFMRRSSSSYLNDGGKKDDNSSNNNNYHLRSKMESPSKLLLQTRTPSAFPPLHKTQLPMRYQTQLYQNPHSTRSISPFCRKNVWIIVFILFSFLLVSMYIISFARQLQFSPAGGGGGEHISKKGYGIIIDAGSSGSRIHVFEYAPGGLIPAVDLVGLESLSLKKTPGLSSFADNPDIAGESLKDLLKFAKQKVPNKEWSKTRVYLMATAGMRRLNDNVREAVLASCREVLQASNFLFYDKWASVISGLLPSPSFSPAFLSSVSCCYVPQCGNLVSPDVFCCQRFLTIKDVCCLFPSHEMYVLTWG